MNAGGSIFVSYDIRATAVEVLREPDNDEAPVTLYCLGLNTSLHLPPDEAKRVAEDMLASLAHNTGEGLSR